MKKFVDLVFMAILCSFILSLVSINTTQAMIPEVTKVESYMMGPDTWVNITINHSPENPSSDPPHFVNILQITVNGNTSQVSIGPVINSPPTDSFSWQYNLGQITDNSQITVTAHCNLDGWGPTSSPVTIPEFPVTALLATFMLVIIVGFLLLKKRQKGNPILTTT
jgi:hypothetical protein